MNDIFYGVVEDNHDPLELGRVRVRILGLHPSSSVANDATGKGLAFDDLPWAHVALPTTSGGVHGYMGHANLLQGSWVVGFSRDASLMNDLVVIGTIPGIPQSVSKAGVPFNDKDGEFPRYANEPDYPRDGRGQSNFEKKRKLKTGNQLPSGSWDETEVDHGGQYQKARVYETTAGHIIIMDDTEGHENIIIQNGVNGSFIDIRKDGTVAIHATGNGSDVTEGSKGIFVGKDLDVTAQGSVNIYCAGSANIQTGGNVKLDAGGSVEANVSGSTSIKSGGSTSVEASTCSIKASGVVNVEGSGINIKGGSGVSIQGSSVNINGKTF